MSGDVTIRVLSADELPGQLRALGALLHACVHAGASIGFVLPFTQGDGGAFWRTTVLPAVQGGGRLLWVARQDGRIAGSVQRGIDTPANRAFAKKNEIGFDDVLEQCGLRAATASPRSHRSRSSS